MSVCSNIYAHQAQIDEEHINTLIWLLDRMNICDTFIGYLEQIRAHKLKLNKIKMALPPKMQHFRDRHGHGANGVGNKNK